MNRINFAIAPAILAPLLSLFCTPAFAELGDPPYFQLLGGEGDSVSMCGASTNGSSCTGNGTAVFEVFNGMPTGTGVIDPFLRFQHNEGDGAPETYEAAYNTDARSLQNDTANSGFVNQAKDENHWNHSIQLGDLQDNNGFYEFYLDINEPGADKSTITIDELQFFIAHTGDMNFYTADEATTGNSGGDTPSLPTEGKLQKKDGNTVVETAEKVWDLDWEYHVGDACAPEINEVDGNGCGGLLIDSVNEAGGGNGSGDWDLVVRLSTSLFDVSGYDSTDYVYLYNFLGSVDKHNDNLFEAEAGFEEWSFLAATEPGGGNSVPEPATAGLMACALFGFVRGRKRRATTIT